MVGALSSFGLNAELYFNIEDFTKNLVIVPCSAKTGEGIQQIWETIQAFQQITRENQAFDAKRQQQSLQWLHESILDRLKFDFYHNKKVQSSLPEIENQVRAGILPVSTAVERLLKESIFG